MGDDKLPTRRVANSGIDADIASLDVDHCFDGWDGMARVWDVGTLAQRQQLPGAGKVLALSPDGKMLATGGTDGVIHLWEMATGRRAAAPMAPSPAAPPSGRAPAAAGPPGS